jgi:hypothetical protein
MPVLVEEPDIQKRVVETGKVSIVRLSGNPAACNGEEERLAGKANSFSCCIGYK